MRFLTFRRVLALGCACALAGFAIWGCGGAGGALRFFLFAGSRSGDDVRIFQRGSGGVLSPAGSHIKGANVWSVVVARKRFLYSSLPGLIAQGEIQSDGSIIELNNPTDIGEAAYSMAVNEARDALYVPDNVSDVILQYRILANGELEPMIPPSVPIAGNPEMVLLHPNGNYLYVTDDTNNVVHKFTINANGSLQTPSVTFPTPVTPWSMAIHPTEIYFYVACFSGFIGQYSIAPNGDLIALSPASVSTGGETYAAAINRDGTLFLTADYGTAELLVYFIAFDGRITFQSGLTTLTGALPWPIEFAPESDLLYVCNQGDNSIGLYRFTISQQPVLVDTYPAGLEPASLAFTSR
jgi:6-phosphogluconolactonase (cycloisomerase 2 family)